MRLLTMILITLLFATAWAWFARAPLLERVLLHELHARQLPVESLAVTTAELDHVVLDEVVLQLGAASVTAQADIRMDWKTRKAQITLTLPRMPLATLLSRALGEGTVVDGMMGGTIPIQVTEKGWRIDPAVMKNIGDLHVAVTPGSASAQALSSHPQADMVLGALSNFQVATMTLNAQSTDDRGGVRMDWRFVGKNPDFMGGKKVDFTLAVNANLEDMLLGLSSAEDLAKQSE